jgi:hypothetical protein
MHKASLTEIDPYMGIGPASGIEKNQVSGCKGVHWNGRSHHGLLLGGPGEADSKSLLNDMGNQP